ncbi:uncharacterized protein METZ01_LOCUS177148 [marine metagenome]|uniref:Uncharacterized protein n=1 Tax=marine metagenome TaxID=408172 RepID=A0A382CEL2_9ZZZZ
MNTPINRESLVKKEKNIENNSIIRNISRNSNENNFELNLVEGTEAYYSERYGWTLRRTK